MKFNEFIAEHGTRSKHAEGAKLPLNDKGDYLLVVGSDSDIGQKAQWDIVRLDKSKDDMIEKMRNIYAGFVIGWSLDEKIGHKKVVELLKEVPSLLAAIIEFTQNDGNFTKP